MNIVNREEEISPDVYYFYHPDHRNNTNNKSQWGILMAEEKSCFINSMDQSWIVNGIGWGLHLINNIISYLGFAQDHNTQVFIAKFIDGTNTNHWHGYPADYLRNQSDVPDNFILNSWRTSQLLSSAKIRKIIKRQPCNL